MNISMNDIDFDGLFGAITDSYYIANHKVELENVIYVTKYDFVATNGTYTKSIDDRTGLLSIKNLVNADYIAYIDINGKIILSIYKHISEQILKDVTDGIKRLWSHIEQVSQLLEEKETKQSPNTPTSDTTSLKQILMKEEGIVDINDLRCSICDSTEFKPLILCDDNTTIEAQCQNCFTIFRFIPSRYYTLHSYSVFPNTMKSRISKDLINGI